MEANVLLVDNVSVYRQALAARLGAIGCNVLEARNLSEANAHFASRRFDVAVVENDLPDESGVAWVQEISARGSDTKLILVVGPGVEPAEIDALAARVGAAKVCLGPLHPNALVREIRSVLGVRSSTPPVVSSAAKPRDDRAAVLVVADDAELIGRVASALMGCDMSVFAVRGVGPMLEEVARRHPHLVLVDADLTDSSGFEVCRKLRDSEVGLRLPMLMAIPQGSPRHRSACFEAGADDYLEKPFADSELVARSRAHVELQLLKRRL